MRYVKHADVIKPVQPEDMPMTGIILYVSSP